MGHCGYAVRGIVDAAKTMYVPIISGNVSLYNETDKGAIPPSPIISCLGNNPDFNKIISPDFKTKGSIVLLIGERLDECGGSVYYQLNDLLGSELPKPKLETIANELNTTLLLMEEGLVLAAHLISKGGMAVALAEMSFRHQIGVNIELPLVTSLHKQLFSETGGFILEIAQNQWPQVESILNRFALSYSKLGFTTENPILNFGPYLSLSILEAMQAFENGLREKL
jgi:phosphoribosylformylglycinamidine synthase